jgi:hypothetical protein
MILAIMPLVVLLFQKFATTILFAPMILATEIPSMVVCLRISHAMIIVIVLLTPAAPHQDVFSPLSLAMTRRLALQILAFQHLDAPTLRCLVMILMLAQMTLAATRPAAVTLA